MVLWKQCLDPFIDLVPSGSSSFLPVVVKLPGSHTSVHVSVYLPTHGKDVEFVSEIASLGNCLEDLCEKYDDPIIYIRGEMNVNAKNRPRVSMLKQLQSKFSLKSTDFLHPTYHHFVGGGDFDSNIDVLLHSSEDNVTEVIKEILCVRDHPEYLSHHDVIISTFTLPSAEKDEESSEIIDAPRINHQRWNISWSEDGIAKYSELVGPQLRRLRESWLDLSSQVSMSLLLQSTNAILNHCAAETNVARVLTKSFHSKPRRVPQEIRKAKSTLKKLHKQMNSEKISNNYQQLRTDFNEARSRVRLISWIKEPCRKTEIIALLIGN